jgi:hypothetical protein
MTVTGTRPGPGEAAFDEGTKTTLSPPDDSVYQALERLRQPETLRKAVSAAWSADGSASLESVRILQTYYKPHRHARLVVEALGRSGGRPVRQYLFVQIYPSEAKAQKRLAATDKKHSLRCTGPPVFAIAKANAVAWSLPNSPRLRPAKIGFHETKFRKFLRRERMRRYLVKRGVDPRAMSGYPTPPQLLRLVPRRRALFRYDVPDAAKRTRLFIKVYQPGHGPEARRNHKLMAKATRKGQLGFRVPRLLTYSTRRRAMVMKRLRGVQLSALVPTADPDVFRRVGEALAGLHQCGLEPEGRWSVDQELEALAAGVDDVKLALPVLKPEVEVILGELRRRRRALRFDFAAPIHGNLFGDQILVDGDSIGIVDWDDLCLGDPLHDVGRLIAHCVLLWVRSHTPDDQRARYLEALLAGYAGRTGREIARPRLDWHVATALLLRAKISSLRPLPPGWMAEIAACVDESRRVLERGT